VLGNDRFEDRGLAGEMIVEAALADADAARELAHRGAAIAALREQIERFDEDALAGGGRGRFRRAGGVDSHALD
jgi:hypothetical protein